MNRMKKDCRPIYMGVVSRSHLNFQAHCTSALGLLDLLDLEEVLAAGFPSEIVFYRMHFEGH